MQVSSETLKSTSNAYDGKVYKVCTVLHYAVHLFAEFCTIFTSMQSYAFLHSSVLSNTLYNVCFVKLDEIKFPNVDDIC